MTPRQRRYMGALTVATFLAMGAALTAGWVSMAFAAGHLTILVVAGWRRLRQTWREGI